MSCSDHAASDAQYADAFRDYGIDINGLGPEAAAALVQVSAIRESLVAALDDWADGISSADKGARVKARRLLVIAQQVDPDPWRNRLRAMVLSGDDGDLEQLARSAPVEELPAATLRLLGERAVDSAYPVVGMLRSKASGPLVELLRRAQRRFPADFWINYELALGAPDGAIAQLGGSHRLRSCSHGPAPQSPAVHLNLGAALEAKGDVDGAIAENRAAIDLKQDYPSAHNNLGFCLARQGHDDAAILEYEEAPAPEAGLPLGAL